MAVPVPIKMAHQEAAAAVAVLEVPLLALVAQGPLVRAVMGEMRRRQAQGLVAVAPHKSVQMEVAIQLVEKAEMVLRRA